MPWKPSEPGEVPTLGYLVIDWITEYLAAPDRPDYEPFVPYVEQEDFILRFYEIDPATGKRRYRRGLLSRPRGWGKSPLLAALSCVEALGPVVPDGWDSKGQPVGKEWATVRTPLVQIAAVSEQQTANTWVPLLEMLQGPVIDAYPGLEPLDTFVNLPRGWIEPITTSPRSVKGSKPVFAVMDQTEEWVKENGGIKMYGKMKNNAAKIGGHFIESPNAFIPGEGSVAENSAAAAEKMREGRTRERGLHHDHREAPPDTDMEERESLTLGLRVAYGDSSGHPDGCVLHDPPCDPGHVDLDFLIGTIWDPTSDPQESRSDFLNQVTHASDAWLSTPEWLACKDSTKIVAKGELITLGFDGSRRRARGVTDATALIGCRVSDGHVFVIQIWEQPEGPDGKDWRVPVVEVEAAVARAFADYTVVGFYADPAKWEGVVANWEAVYGPQIHANVKAHAAKPVKAQRANPIEWWMTGGRSLEIVRALEAFHGAVVEREMTQDGNWVLHRHAVNARRRKSSSGIQIHKEHPDSDKKIDAVVAAVLAWQARLDVIAAGITQESAPMGGWTF